MLRSSPLLLWMALTAAGWSAQSGSTEVDLGAGMSDYTYVQACVGQRRVVASPVYARVQRVEANGLVMSGEVSASLGQVQVRGSDAEAAGESCSSPCVGDRVGSGLLTARVGYESRLVRAEIGPALTMSPNLGWFPATSLLLRYGDPYKLYVHASLLAGPFTGNVAVDVIQLGLGRRWSEGEVLVTTSPLVLDGFTPPALRFMGVMQVGEGVGVGLDLGGSLPAEITALPGLRGLVLLRLRSGAL